MGAEEPSSLGAGASVDPAAVAAEARRLADERYVALFTPQRTGTFFAGVVGFAVVLGALTFVPFLRGFLRVGPTTMIPALVVGVSAIGFATVRGRGPGGVADERHKSAERAESVVTAGLGAFLIAASGSATSIFWLISIMHAMVSSQEIQHARLTQRAHGVSLGAVSIFFAASGRLADAAGVAFFTLLLLFFARTQETAARSALEFQAERNVVRARYESLLVGRERQRIARDLHDGVGAQIASLAWSAEALALGAADKEALAEISRRARSTLGELREVVHGLKAANMRVGELAAAVLEPCRALATSCELTVTSEGDDVVLAEQCLEVTLIAREAVRNAVQHARARRICVHLATVDGALVVRVEDDGDGLDAAQIASSRGGLSHLRERAERLRGALSFEAPPDGGTAIIMRAPLTRA